MNTDPRESPALLNSLGTAVTRRALNRYNAWAAIRRRAKAAGFLTPRRMSHLEGNWHHYLSGERPDGSSTPSAGSILEAALSGPQAVLGHRWRASFCGVNVRLGLGCAGSALDPYRFGLGIQPRVDDSAGRR